MADENENGKKFILKEWVAILIAIGGVLFSAGGFYFEVGTLRRELAVMRNELARKDVLEVQLGNMTRTLNALDAKVERLLERQ